MIECSLMSFFKGSGVSYPPKDKLQDSMGCAGKPKLPITTGCSSFSCIVYEDHATLVCMIMEQ